jgi:phosphonate transport system substrate-binding protein
MRLRQFRFILFNFFLYLWLAGCLSLPGNEPAGYVDLNNLHPLPTPANKDVIPLRVAIAAVISPQGSAESYAPLLEYISHRVGRPVEAVQRRTYTEVNDLLRSGEVELAFVCTSSYILGAEEFDLRLLAAPQVHGETVYYAKLIVQANGPYRSLEDLRGRRFAFTDPTSFSGRVYPTYLLQEMKETPQSFFSDTFFTYSHDKAIYAVADGTVDSASVDSLVLDFALKRDPGLASRLRVIHTSPAFGIPPVVISPLARPQLRAQLADILLNAHTDPQGQAALAALDYDRFIIIGDISYQSARDVESQVTLDSPEQE